MGCEHLDEVYELFLLGTLGAEDASEVRAHLERRCPNCLERLREAAKTVCLLAQMSLPRRPNPKWKLNLLRALRQR